jgi:hypothetical protein
MHIPQAEAPLPSRYRSILIFLYLKFKYMQMLYILNLLEGYFFVHNFFDREKITYVLLKVSPHVKYWWETFCEQKKTNGSTLFVIAPTWGSFRDNIKEQYYPIGSYDDLNTRWTTLWHERDQTLPEFTNVFHTLCTKLGIKDYEINLVFKCHDDLHRYI